MFDQPFQFGDTGNDFCLFVLRFIVFTVFGEVPERTGFCDADLHFFQLDTLQVGKLIHHGLITVFGILDLFGLIHTAFTSYFYIFNKPV